MPQSRLAADAEPDIRQFEEREARASELWWLAVALILALGIGLVLAEFSRAPAIVFVRRTLELPGVAAGLVVLFVLVATYFRQSANSLSRENRRLVCALKEGRQSLQRQLQRLDTLYEASRALGGTLDLDAALDLVADIFSRASGASAVLVGLKGEGEGFTVRARRTAGLPEWDGAPKPLEAHGLFFHAMQGDKVTYLEEVEGLASSSPLLPGLAAKGVLVVPLQGIRDYVGAVALCYPERVSVPEEELHMLSTLGRHAGVAVENALLHRRIEAELETRLGQLSAMVEIARDVNAALELPEVLARIGEKARQMAGGEAASVMLLDPGADQLRFQVALGEAGRQVAHYVVPLGKGIAGWVAEEKKPALVPDAPADPRFMSEVDAQVGFRTTSVLAVPIAAGGRVLGVIEVLNKVKGGAFTHEDLAMVEAVAEQAATAVEHARLYEEARSVHLRTLRGLATVLADRTPHMRGHLQRVRDYALRLALALRMAPEEQAALADAAMLHDIGLIAVREEVVNKAGPLTPEERAEVERHPVVGARLVESTPRLAVCAPTIRHHHERWDGTGYPDHLRADDIPLAARVLGVVEAYETMTAPTPYRLQPLSREQAIAQLQDGAGTQFDPLIVSRVVAMLSEPDSTVGLAAPPPPEPI
jgi:GAF domain-containing protein